MENSMGNWCIPKGITYQQMYSEWIKVKMNKWGDEGSNQGKREEYVTYGTSYRSNGEDYTIKCKYIYIYTYIHIYI